MIDTVIFDFDGTLVNTNNLILNSFNHIYCKYHNRNCDEDYVLSTFGEPLEWEALEAKRACRIRKTVGVGGWRDEEKWPDTYEAMADAMVRLEKALKPYLQKL